MYGLFTHEVAHTDAHSSMDATTTITTPSVSALLSEELKPTREFQGDRRIAQKLSVKARLQKYELSDDQMILDLKKAVIQDPEASAGHLKPGSLRVTQTLTSTGGDWDPKRVIYQDKSAVEIELTDEQTIGECKRGAVELSVSVELRPTGLTGFVEKVKSLF